jgi:hypothetical protein
MWPHKFTKTGKQEIIGEEQVLNKMTRPIYATEMACVHCRIKYTHGKQQQPSGPCPARKDETELKRLKNA